MDTAAMPDGNNAMTATEFGDIAAEEAQPASPVISIIVPVYNGAAYLPRCLNSLVKQTEQNIEIVVVNDGSTDDTQAVIDRFQQEYPEKIIGLRQENKGVSAARNLGLSVARGEFIGFADADDKVSLRFCEHMLWNIRKTGADLAECGRINLIARGGKLRERPVPSCKEHVIDMTKGVFINKGSLFVWDKLFKKSIIDAISLRFDEDIKYAEDALFLVKYKFSCRTISFVHKNLYYYTEYRADSASGTSKSMLDLPPCMERLIEISFHTGRHREVIGQIGDMAAGYYVRRIHAFIRNPHPEMENFISAFQEFFSRYIPNWQGRVCRYRARGSKFRIFVNRYRLTLTGIRLFLAAARCCAGIQAAPSFLKKLFGALKKYCKRHKIIDRYAAFRKQPIRPDDILLVSFFGAGISDNILPMIKALRGTGKNILIGTNYKERDRFFCRMNNIPGKLVAIHSPEYLEALARSKYLVLNSRFPAYFNKRDEQILLNTWHGTPLKALGRRVRRGLSDLGNNQCQFLMSDYLLFPNEHTGRHMTRDFSLDTLFRGKSIYCGYPRNAVFFDREAAARLRHKLGLKDKRVFAYMPTWRGDTLSSLDIQKNEKELRNILTFLDDNIPDDVVIFVKLHQVIINKIKLSSYRHIRNFDASCDTYQFLSMTDCLITDYSSVMFDFINTEKPIILFLYDYDSYIANRGTYIDIKSLNFEKCFSAEELVSRIRNFTGEKRPYAEEKNAYCLYDGIETPQTVTEILLAGTTGGKARIQDHSCSQTQYTLCLMPQLTSEKKIEQFFNIKQTIENAVFVFAQETFSRKTECLLQEYNDEITYIITPITGIHSTKQLLSIHLALHNVHLGSGKVLKEDLDRLARGLRIKDIRNFSRYKWFRFMEKEWNYNKKIQLSATEVSRSSNA